MSIGIVGAGNMGRSIATCLGKTGERVVLADRDPAKAEAVVAEIGGGEGLSAGGLDDALTSEVVVLARW
jgi:predicted dinucleotide-binding enzyme